MSLESPSIVWPPMLDHPQKYENVGLTSEQSAGDLENSDGPVPAWADALWKIRAEAVVDEDVAADCWGAWELVIIQDIPEVLARRHDSEHMVRIFWGVALFLSNWVIQGSLVYFIAARLMLPSFLSAQNLYKEFHSKVFVNHNFNQSKFDDETIFSDSLKEEICSLAMGQNVMTKMVLFIWVSLTFEEMWTAVLRFKVVYHLDTLPADCPTTHMCEMVKNTKTGKDELYVICLNPRTRFLVNAMVQVPKMIIALFLGVIGSFWLMASMSIGDLILNSLALEFVTKVDELMAFAFFPQCFLDLLVVLRYKRKATEATPGMSAEASAKKLRMQSYMVHMIKFVVAGLAVECLFVVQPVIPGYSKDVADSCVKYLREQVPWCSYGNTSCFPTP